MAKPVGHVELNGKQYIIMDGSYQSRMVPLFRPQMVVEGVSREALDTYLYQVQETWDMGTNRQGLLGRWKVGGYRTVDGLDTSEAGKLRLQFKTTLSLAYGTPPVKGRLVSFGGFLYLFGEDGTTTKRTSNGTTWTEVTYDEATHGNITAADTANASWMVFGTSQGKVFLAAPGSTITPINVQDLGSDAIKAVKVFRGHVFAGYGNVLDARSYDTAGNISASTKYVASVPGAVQALAVWSQGLMAGIQTGNKGSLVAVADLTQVVDTYELFGEFLVESLMTWGSFLLYGGNRPGRSSELYTFREILSDRWEKVSSVPIGVSSILPLAEFALAGWNEKAGLWWVDQKGSGPYAQYTTADAANSIVRGIAHFSGNVYYTVDGVGVIKTETNQYRTTGTLDSGWFDGGFPELNKDWADLFVRLEDALATGQSVSVSVRKEGETPFTSVGSLAVGDTFKFLSLPSSHKQSKRLEIRVTLGSGGSDTPTVSAIVLRYRTVPIQKRGWTFTIRAEQGLTFADGSRETRDPGTIIDDLMALQAAGSVTFATALEPTQRTVYVQNAQLVSQLVGKDRPTPIEAEEGFVAIEVVEA